MCYVVICVSCVAFIVKCYLFSSTITCCWIHLGNSELPCQQMYNEIACRWRAIFYFSRADVFIGLIFAIRQMRRRMNMKKAVMRKLYWINPWINLVHQTQMVVGSVFPSALAMLEAAKRLPYWYGSNENFLFPDFIVTCLRIDYFCVVPCFIVMYYFEKWVYPTLLVTCRS